jgi:pentatricopeptide repeat protein
MFTCRACTRRALALLSEVSLPAEAARVSLPRCAPSRVPAPVRMYHADAASIRAAIAEPSEPKRDDGQDDKPKRGVTKSMEWSVKKRLEYLADPYHIAIEVQKILAVDRLDEATLLVQTASKNAQVPVSWNYLIDYQMRKQRLHAAIKLFNDMKKRGQLPTAATYTTIFRGCAHSQHPKLAVAEALKLYNNMMASGRITPNTIHMNAVLHVCARAGDIETMFTIVQSRGQENHRAANHQTYTTIINALRSQFPRIDHSHPIPEGRDAAIAETIVRTRAIWDEVIARWQASEIAIDEDLVCAMGRTLLMGGFHRNNEVFALLEQTMNIPADPELLSRESRGAAKRTSPSPAADPSSTPSTEADSEAGRNMVVEVKAKPKTPLRGFAQPGNNSLSLVLQAILNTGKVALARRYWTIFTEKYQVEPDAENWHSLMRTLRRGKSSTKTVEYLEEMPKYVMGPRTFRTAMATCLRDNLNKSMFNNATRVLEIMLTSIRVPDMLAMRIYLRTAYANKRHFEEMATKKKDPNFAKLAWGRQISTALENLWEPYQIAAKQFTHGGLAPVSEKKFVEAAEREAWVKEAAPRAELASLARKMIAAYDRIIFEKMIPEEIASRLGLRRNSLNRFVVKYFEDREKHEPGWRRNMAALEDKEEDDWIK